MVKYKNKLSAAAVFLVMCFTLVMSGYDSMTSVGATGGTDYVKYTYATGTQETYNLPEIPVDQNITAMTARAMSDYVDPRPNADLDTAVVSLYFYTYNDNNVVCTAGTGFIIGDHEIMTAAHCAYNFSDSATVTIPNANPYTSEAITFNVVAAHVPQAYINYETINNIPGLCSQDVDYAILTVSEDLSQYGSFLLGMGTSSIKGKSVPIHCMGYQGNELKISNGLIININNIGISNNYETNLYSYYQTSGSPIYTESYFGVPNTTNEDYVLNRYRTAISLVSTSYNDNNGSHTYGIIIGSEILQFAYSNNYL